MGRHGLEIRSATSADWPSLRSALIELQEYERRLHETRLPGADVADPYLQWIIQQTHKHGAILLAELDGAFAGFVAGWVVQEKNIAETADSNQFGYISDICVLPPFRGRRIATRLLHQFERQLRRAGVNRVRIGVLASNKSARAIYDPAGFTAYEMVYANLHRASPSRAALPRRPYKI